VADPGRGRGGLSRSERERLERAYLATTYRVHEPEGSIDLRIGQASAPLDRLLDRNKAPTWAFVSAANPGSVMLAPADNSRRHAALVEAVQFGGFCFIEATGIPADASWPPEPNLLIFGISRSAARLLGRRFGQLAVLAGRRGGVPELVWC
jgi:hypothetical protein